MHDVAGRKRNRSNTPGSNGPQGITAVSKKSSKLPETEQAVTSTEELSRILGLSRWTVSRALHGNPKVKPETRRRVHEAMRKYGFTPSPTIRGLFGHSSGVIGVCLNASAAHLPIVERKLSVIQRLLATKNKSTLLEVVEVGTPAVEAVSRLSSYRVDGIIFLNAVLQAAETLSPMMERFRIPMVTIESTPLPAVSSVSLDRCRGSLMVAEHLWELGHRRAAILSVRTDPERDPRYQGFQKFFQSRGVDPERCLWRFHGPEERFLQTAQCVPDLLWFGKELADDLLSDPDPPRAIHASNDYVAYGVIERLRARGFRVPEDFSVTGFEDSCRSAWGKPFLTTIDTNIDTTVAKAVSLLGPMHKTSGQLPKVRHATTKPTLQVRASTAPPPKNRRKSS